MQFRASLLQHASSTMGPLYAYRHEMEAVRPVLIVAPATMLPFWQGELGLWVGPDANVVPYAGSTAARTMLHDNELWLAPGSMDGKSATFKTREALPLRVRLPGSRLKGSTVQLPVCWRLINSRLEVRTQGEDPPTGCSLASAAQCGHTVQLWCRSHHLGVSAN